MTISRAHLRTEQAIYVTTFGSFSIRSGDQVLRDSDNRMKQLWNMLLYLLVHRGREVPQEELISVLWAHKGSDNPVNALKNLAYRIRKLLEKKGFPFAKQILLFDHGTYRLNNDLPWVMDWEHFDHWLEKSKDLQQDSPRQLGALMRVADVYQGHFLEHFVREAWVAALSARYKNTYTQVAGEVCSMLHRRQLWEKLLPVSQRAAELCPYNEGLQRSYIRALLEQGRQRAALRQYQLVLDTFYREFGVRPSEGFYDLYQEISATEPRMEQDLDGIMRELQEQEQVQAGAFYCEYAVFKQLYREMSRILSRSALSVPLALFTMSRSSETSMPDKKIWGRSMDMLLDAIRGNVRMGDAVCRFSPTQYLIMLPYTDYENALVVTKRILHYYKQAQRGYPMHVAVSVRAVEPRETP